MKVAGTRATVSIRQWKAVLLVLVLVPVLAALHLWALSNWHRYAGAGHGTLAVTLGEADRDSRLPVTAMGPDSPFAKAGVKPGDSIVFDRHGDALRKLGTGSPTAPVKCSRSSPTPRAWRNPYSIPTC
jgi:hypothetical protein